MLKTENSFKFLETVIKKKSPGFFEEYNVQKNSIYLKYKYFVAM